MKNYKVVLVLLVLLAIVGGFFYWKNNHKNINESGNLPSKDRGLTAEQVKYYSERISKAIDFGNGLNKNDPGYKDFLVNNYLYLGQQYFGLGELQKSKEMYEKAVEVKPDESQAFVGLAMVLEEAGDFNAQAEALKKAVNLAPENTDIWVRYLNLRKKTGSSLEDMEKLFKIALEKTNRHVDILVNKAIYESENGNFTDSIKLWEEAIVKNPGSSSAYQAEINKIKK